jgi:hypothetical protein
LNCCITDDQKLWCSSFSIIGNFSGFVFEMQKKRRTVLKKKRQKEKSTREKQILFLGVVICICVVLLIRVSVFEKMDSASTGIPVGSPSPSVKETTQSVLVTEQPKESQDPSEDRKNSMEQVYSYLQGPKSWEKGLDWSGEWGVSFMDGDSFGGFGCGFCCLANVYSTLTDYRCSPVDMYRYAKKHTGYCGGMAIAWGYMRRTLTSVGFDCHVEKKPQTYQEFAEDIADSDCSIVLVSSNDSAVYWKDTSGHYVTVFAYDRSSDKVFLTDSGDPQHNRQWVSLKKIYRSLKTASSWQYIVVKGYQASKDHWKHKSTSGAWNRPSYLENDI